MHCQWCLYSFINIPKYSLKLASSLATIFVKMNTFRGVNKNFNPLKITAEVFFFYSPSPMTIMPLFLEKKEQIKHRIFISQLHVSGNVMGRKVSSGAALMLVFLSEKNCIRPKKCPWDLIIFLYYFSLQRHLLFYCVALLKKKIL